MVFNDFNYKIMYENEVKYVDKVLDFCIYCTLTIYENICSVHIFRIFIPFYQKSA